MRLAPSLAALTLCAGTIVLAGCGGGGGGSSSPALPSGAIPPTTSPTASPTAPPTFMPKLTEYPVNPKAGPAGITLAPDGNMYYTEANNAAIGKITVTGVASDIPVPQSAGQVDITTGPDGALWFIDQTPFVGRLDLAGGVTTTPVPGGPNSLDVISVGSDHRMWFGGAAFSIGVLDPASRSSITYYQFPNNGGSGGSLTLGGDGALWTSDPLLNNIYRIGSDGKVSVFPIPTANAFPVSITKAPDGSLWFGEGTVAKLGHVSTSGQFSSEILLPKNDSPIGMVFGPDGKIYVTVNNPLYGSAIDQVDPVTGAVIRLRRNNSGSVGIIVGPDKNIWFIEEGLVGKLTIN